MDIKTFLIHKYKNIPLLGVIILLFLTFLPINTFASEGVLSFNNILNNNAIVYLNNHEYSYDYKLDEYSTTVDGSSFDMNTFLSTAMTTYEQLSLKNHYLTDNKLSFTLDNNMIAYYLDNSIDGSLFNKIDKTITDRFKISFKASTLNVEAILSEFKDHTLIIEHKKAKDVLDIANQLSATISDLNNNILYYGKINDAEATSTTLVLPEDLIDGEYIISVFAEQVNSANYSNYSSDISSINFKKEKIEVLPSQEVVIETTPDIGVIEPEMAPTPNAQPEEIVSECENDALCSHVYRDLQGELIPLCSKGKELILSSNQDDKLLSQDVQKYNPEKNILSKMIPTSYIKADGKTDFELYIPSEANKERMNEATDSVKELSQSGKQNYADYGDGLVYIEFDLGELYKITSLNLWRYYLDGRTYRNTVIVSSKDKSFVDKNIIYNADAENLFGFGNGTDPLYQESVSGRTFNFKDKNIEAQYIRIYMNGSTDGTAINKSNHIVEIELFGTKIDKFFNHGIYFVGMTNLVNEAVKYHGIKYDNIIDRVDAHFLSDSGNEKVYRMVELSNGIFSTVVPPSYDNSYFCKVYFNIHFHNQNNEHKIHTTEIIYDFDAMSGTKDHITVPYNSVDNIQGKGEFALESDIGDCYYWQCTYEDSYWSGRPSSDNRILDDQVLYIDNSNIDLNSENALNNAKPIWDKVYISYLNNDKTQFISKEVVLETRHPLRKYYLFPKGINLTENTLIAVSNGELRQDGTFVDESINNKEILFFLYNIKSKDNTLLLRNIGKSEDRILTSFTVKPENTARFIGFRDQLHGKPGAIISDDNSLYYSVAKADAQGGVDINSAAPMKQMTLLKNDNPNFTNIDHGVLFFTDKISSDYEYIKFFKKECAIDGSMCYDLPITDYLKIDDSVSVPTFFPDSYQNTIVKKGNPDYDSNTGFLLNGYFTSIMQSNYRADAMNEIPYEKNKSYNPDYLYGNATFYDYYDDGQMLGYVFDSNKEWRTYSKIFNEEVHDYYIDKTNGTGKSNPFYLYASDKSTTGFSGQKYYGYDGAFNKTPNHSSPDYIVADGNADKVLTNGNLTSDGIPYPIFDESFLRGNNSLKTAIGNVYKDVSFPFKLNDNGYWEFDSAKAEYATRLKEDPSGGYYLDLTNSPIVVDKTNPNKPEGINGFFPFNDASDGVNELNYHFGMKMDIDFSITNNGKIKVKKGDKIENRDIEFKFNGDDDFLLYVDDVLILDLTGIHAAVNGVINFATGDVTYSSTRIENGGYIPDLTTKTSQTNLYEALGKEAIGPEYLASGNHKIRIFYTERGRGTSNLKIEFNFPKKNTLNITNEVDLSSASNIFDEVLDYVGGFRYRIKNQATSGIKLPVENSTNHLITEGTLALDISKQKFEADKEGFTVFEKFKTIPEKPVPSYANEILKIQNVGYPHRELNQIQMKELINYGKFWNTISTIDNSTYDLSKYSHIGMNVYNNSNIQSNTGIILNIKIEDNQGNIVNGGVNEFMYETHSNSLPIGKWSIVRVDLNKISEKNPALDLSNIKSVSFALGVDKGAIYIDDLRANGKLKSGVSLGFSVGENEISDYKSLDNAYDGIKNSYNYNKAILSNIEGSWYKSSDLVDNISTIIPVNKDSTFDLANLDKVTFTDKFREGSYINLEQVDETKNVAFKTTWSILENAIWENGKYTSGYIDDNYLSLFPGKKTVVNNVNDVNLSITNQSGHTVSDNRVVISDDTKSGYIYAYKENYANPGINFNDNGSTFVYRSYIDPDNLHKGDIDLTVAYKNELLTGGIIITKKLVNEDGTPYVAKTGGETFEFHIKYQDVMGTNLENNIYANSIGGPGVLQNVKLTVPEGKSSASIVIYGIPKNTNYSIHEVNNVPKEIDINGNDYQYVNVNNPDYVGPIDVNSLNDTILPIDSPLRHETKIEQGMIIENHMLNVPVVKGKTNESIKEIIFTNEVIENYQEVKIVKKLSNTVYSEEKSFIFHVHYDLNGKPIIRDVVVGVDAFKTQGFATIKIPANVSYIVHEVTNDNFSLIELEGATEQLINKNYICNSKEYTSLTVNGTNKLNVINVTNRGPQSLIIKKNSVDINGNHKSPLKDAEFTIFDNTNSNIIENGQVKSSYYFVKKINKNDKNYNSTINRYYINNKFYIVNDIAGQLEYYVPLTKEEVLLYDKSELNTNDEVVALAIFDDIKLTNKVKYIIKETKVPSGHNNNHEITLYIENGVVKIESTDNTILMPKLLTKSDNDIQIEVNNKINNLAFSFYKKNRDGEKLEATFALYAIKEENKNNLVEYNLDNTLTDNSKLMLIQDAPIREAISDQYNEVPVIFRGLSPDITYRLVETKEPYGYKKPDGQWNIKYDNSKQKFVISKVGNPSAFVGSGTSSDPYILINYKLTDIPSTGGIGNIQLYGIAIMIISASYWLYMLVRRNRIIKK